MSQNRQIGSELERLYLQSIKAANLQDWAHKSPQGQEFLDHISDDFVFRSEQMPPLGWADAVHYWETYFARLPKFHINVQEVSSDVDEKGGNATVHVQSEAIGGVLGGEETKYVYFAETCWRFDRGLRKWLCFEMSGVRGSAQHQGFV